LPDLIDDPTIRIERIKELLTQLRAVFRLSEPG
jgi:hypothetical protein